MVKGKSVHVLPRKDVWIIRKEGHSKATSVHPTKRDAVEAARKLARDQSSELVIHGRDGRIRNRDSYGPDPLLRRSPEVLFPLTAGSASEKAIRDAVSAVVQKSKNGSKVSARSS